MSISLKTWGLTGGLLLPGFTWLSFPAEMQDQGAAYMAVIALMMAIFWMTEALPLAATALIPLVAFPLLGLSSTKSVASAYINSTIFLFIGGFLLAIALQRWDLHKRIALAILSWIGAQPKRLILGFLLASAFLSMWISNTATAIMMVPIALSIIQRGATSGAPQNRSLTIGLLIAIAYGATLGGITTLVGTPPNLSLQRIYAISFPQADAISFGQWFLFALPLGCALLSVAWWMLTKSTQNTASETAQNATQVRQERAALGRFSYAQKWVAMIFSATALLWVFRQDIVLGSLTLPGWSNLLPRPKLIDDATVAIAMALLLFFIPAQQSGRKRLLELDAFAQLPWSIVLLFGGGFALAQGFVDSGLSTLIGEQFRQLPPTSTLLIIAIVVAVMALLTELTSNTATTELMLPILASVALALDIAPLTLMIPATLAASCAFMLPVATPPNAIVFGSGHLRIQDMLKTGLRMNVIAIVVITLFLAAS